MVEENQAPHQSAKRVLEIHPIVLCIIAIVLFVVGACSGYWHWKAPYVDWLKHYAILHDLVMYDWPVCYEMFGETRMLSYYIGIYLLPALVGKIFGGCMVAEITMGFYLVALSWCVVILILYYCNCNTGWKQMLCLLFVFFFYGMSVPCHKLHALAGAVGGNHVISADLPNIYYLHIRIPLELLSVYIQGLVPLGVFLCLLIIDKPIQEIGLYLFPTLLFSPFMCVGLFLLFFIKAILDMLRKQLSFREIFTASNIICLIAGLLLLIYFSGNFLLEKPGNTGFSVVKIMNLRNLFVMLSFCLFMFGFHLMIVFKNFCMESLFISLCISLWLVPFFTMGIYNDWFMNVSIPLSFLLSFYVWRYLNSRGSVVFKFILSLMFIIGVWGSSYEAVSLVEHAVESPCAVYRTTSLLDYINHEIPTERMAYRYNYVSGDVSNDVFYKYVSSR